MILLFFFFLACVCCHESEAQLPFPCQCCHPCSWRPCAVRLQLSMSFQNIPLFCFFAILLYCLTAQHPAFFLRQKCHSFLLPLSTKINLGNVVDKIGNAQPPSSVYLKSPRLLLRARVVLWNDEVSWFGDLPSSEQCSIMLLVSGGK